MENETPTHGWQRGTKRSYAEIESHSRSRSRSSPYGFMAANDGPSESRNDIHLPPLRRQTRWSGDGFDFRRPMRSSDSPMSFTSSTSTSTSMMTDMSRRQSISIIDLTNEDSPTAITASSATRRGRNTPRPTTRPSSPPPPALFSAQPRTTFGQASRGPRYPQEIIDLSADSPEVTTHPAPYTDRQTRSTDTQTDAGRSPEVEFLSVRSVRPVLPPPSRNARPPTADPFLRHIRRELPELEVENDPEVQITGVHEVQRHGGAARQLIASLGIHMGMLPGLDQERRPRVFVGHGLQGRLRFAAPDLDFQIAGFHMGFDMGDIGDDRADTASPPVIPPSAAPEGFTRSPAEGDELVCPNCDDELCTGDSDLKKQVWIVKTCGHVYCGGCTANRAASKRGRGRSSASVPKPFKTCVVEGCGKKTTHPLSMIQVYL